MSYEISLSRLLENKARKLHGRLPRIREQAEALLIYTQVPFPHYTPHGFSHSISVEENLDWLIPDEVKEKMNDHEVFFLIVAAWLHDWGMIGEQGEDAEHIRRDHHIRTERNFEKMHQQIGLTEHEARIVGRISKGHRKVDLNSDEYDDALIGQNIKIRSRFLAALLRIADECDITHNRTPEVIYYSINPSGQAKEEFDKHLSIMGIGQLQEKHKIYINAVAKDPRGARTLRDVRQKIQTELDVVKTILAQNDVPLDLVDLKLETRGFIDKPIGFEINKEKIVELLVGDHLYARNDVAIRELVQNSIDSCLLKKTLDPGSSCKIVLQIDNRETLVIEDDGFGMGYYEAKKYLSSIGDSFYHSDELQDALVGKTYRPIGLFGIGILSCFLISDRIVIETLQEGAEPCKFTIDSLNNEWKFEKGSLANPGTRVSLNLSEGGRTIDLEASLLNYFLFPEVPIDYTDGTYPMRRLETGWSADLIYQRFMRDRDDPNEVPFAEMMNLTTENYDVIVGVFSGHIRGQLFLFNHGIHVGNFYVAGLAVRRCICVNLKRDLVDLHLSREQVKRNRKWDNFIYSLSGDIFRELVKTSESSNQEDVMAVMGGMIEDRMTLEVCSERELFEKVPILRCFLEHAPFPVLAKGAINVANGIVALDDKDACLYSCCSHKVLEELELVSQIYEGPTLVANPYELPTVKSLTGGRMDLLTFLRGQKGIPVAKLEALRVSSYLTFSGLTPPVHIWWCEGRRYGA